MATTDKAPRAEGQTAEVYDREISLKGILATGAGIVGVTLLSMLAMWGMFNWFENLEEKAGRELTPAERQERERLVQQNELRREEIGDQISGPMPRLDLPQDAILPPGPRLQVSSRYDMERMRREEVEILEGYGWVDRSGGVARIPIERAMDILAERGLPQRPAPVAAEDEVTEEAPAETSEELVGETP